MKRAYITGAYGMLGAALCSSLAGTYELAGCDIAQKPSGTGFVADRIDITDQKAVYNSLLRARPNIVIHTAAYIDVDGCETNPALARKLNSDATRELCVFTNKLGAKFIYISTDAVFDGTKVGGYNEDDDPCPINVYGQTKLEGEQAVLDSSPENLVLRTNIYGWNIQPKVSFAEWVYNSLTETKRINMFTDVFYTPTYVYELARIMVSLDLDGIGGIVNAVGCDCCSKFDFGVALARVFGLDASLIERSAMKDHIGFKARRPANMCLSSNKVSKLLGRRTQSLEDGLKEFRAEQAVRKR